MTLRRPAANIRSAAIMVRLNITIELMALERQNSKTRFPRAGGELYDKGK
jgi:hypothetical protein